METDSIKKSCSSCISLTKVCKRTGKVDDEVCEGVIKEQAPIIRKVIPTMDISGRDGHLLCASIMNSCPYPVVEQWNVTFPKPKPDLAQKPIESEGKTFTVLQLSDWHIDPEYQSGTEVYCDKPICCRSAYTDYTNITKKASVWGDYNCDTPLSLIESLLNYIPQVEPDIKFGILTGDIPPHEVWSTLPFGKTQLIQDVSYQLLHDYFDSPFLVNSVLYPAIGNHEAAPTNNFPLNHSKIPFGKDYLNLMWLYESLAHNWQGWLPPHSHSLIEKNSGSYSTRPMPGLKLISLNTNFCYVMNWWLYERPASKDPNGILGWLVKELQDAEDRNERVWIIGHIAPGDSTCFHDYSNYYSQIIERYSHIISAQFFGHTHRDELTIFYRNGKERTADNAVSVGYIAPSITPFLNLNPGFRTYKVDTKTFEIVDSITYIADLDKATDLDHEPNWHIEYSAREAYNSTRAHLARPNSPLSASWWHNVTVDMEQENLDSFSKYHHFMSKSTSVVKECDEKCKKNTICSIRAGNSEHRCDYESDLFEPERYKPELHLCGPALSRNFKK
ncbi:hypothetical protein G6F37_005542 [Rhizopus arrhizus]|nr:hypothetical protein G6F37_005542 [Rhizopus arrhizus]